MEEDLFKPIFEASDSTLLIGILGVLSTALKLGNTWTINVIKKGNSGEKAITLLLNLIKIFLPKSYCFSTIICKFFKVNE